MLELKNITKHVGSFCLNDISLKLNKGDYFVLLGMSGSGKSLLLETIAGLIQVEQGHIILNERDITHTKIQKRKIVIVFQHAAIFPHLTVFQNIAYPLKVQKLPSKLISERVNKLAEITSIKDFLLRKPDGLSGGELQRVALARALALEPDILLLDEPLSSLDVILRSELRALLRKINKTGQTVIHVTHDYHEAAMLANKVGVIENGTLKQVGSLEEVFENPQSDFVANFVGVPNFYSVESSSIQSNLVKIKDSPVSIYLNQAIETSAYISINPECIRLFSEKPTDITENIFKAKIIEFFPVYNGIQVIIDIGIELIAVFSKEFVVDSKVQWVHFSSENIKIIPQNVNVST